MEGKFAVGATLPAPGQVVRVEDTDYRYGVGLLTLRVHEVGEPHSEGNSTWVTISGYKMHGSEEFGGRREFEVRVGGIVIVPAAGG